MLASAGPVSACNKERWDPEDVDRFEAVVVGTITNYRVVPYVAEGSGNGRRVEAVYGIFDVTVERTLKGAVPPKFIATLRDWSMCCFGPNRPSDLPEHLGPEKALIAFNAPDMKLVDQRYPTVAIDVCVGPFLFKAPSAMQVEIATYLRERRSAKRKH